jgi:hypothetical protein
VRAIFRPHCLLSHRVTPLAASLHEHCLSAGHYTSRPALPSHLAVKRGPQLGAVGRRGIGKVGRDVCELCHWPSLLSLLHMVAKGVMVEAAVSSHAILQGGRGRRQQQEASCQHSSRGASGRRPATPPLPQSASGLLTMSWAGEGGGKRVLCAARPAGTREGMGPACLGVESNPDLFHGCVWSVKVVGN